MSQPGQLVRPGADVYAALNDFLDGVEALPADLVRHFTLLREVDAKTADLQALLSTEIKSFFDSTEEPSSENRGYILANIRQILIHALPCSDEKVSLCSVAADVAEKLVGRLESDIRKMEDYEIPDEIKYGDPNHPALVEQANASANAHLSRTELRKEAVANRREVGSRVREGSTPVKKRRVGGFGSGNASPPRMGPVLERDGPARRTGNMGRNKGVSRGQSRRGHGEYSPMGSPIDEYADSFTDRAKEEDVYCYCRQVSYGEMIGCDGENCPREWFHLGCIGLTEPPRGEWYCAECSQRGAHKVDGRRRRRGGRRQ